MELETGLVVTRAVELALRHDFPARGAPRDRGCSGVADPGARSGQGDLRGACVRADRGAQCGCPCAADEAGYRGGDSGRAGGAHQRPSR